MTENLRLKLRWLQKHINHIGLTILGEVGAIYLRAVRFSCREFNIFPIDYLSRAKDHTPCIIATWHGQNYIAPFARRKNENVHVLVSRSRDGQIFAKTIARLGFKVVPGSGAGKTTRDSVKKGGTVALQKMIDVLANGDSVAMTADVPKISRIAGLGIVVLASHSGCPIVPMAAVTSRSHILKNWDQTAINCLFSRATIFIGEPIYVDNTNDDEALEKKRLEVEFALNSVNERAKALAMTTVKRPNP